MVAGILAVFGIIFGSFVNALVWRLHERAALAGKKGKAAVRRREELSIVKGRSMCPHCGHELAAKDLIPVISWLWLRGKCRYCGARIPDSPLVELATGLLFAVSYVAWPYDMHGVGLFRFACWLVFLVGFVALALYDLRWYLLPDRLVFPLTGLAVVQVVVVAIWQRSLSDLWLPAAGAAVIFGLFWLLYQVSSGSWIGGGDVKLGIVLGLLAGTPLRGLAVIFFASLIGTILSIPQFFKGREGLTRRIPFGPSLLLGVIVMVLWGMPIINWYQRLIIR
ncbi:MAG TPA: prepilin peptidase [Candidatus Saccharimonadales bacterium]|jgi:prepilin signal peptidase PulO-like enzyme (type II secretory pathway)